MLSDFRTANRSRDSRARETPRERRPAPTLARTILIVEDDLELTRLARRHLESHEFQVFVAGDAASAMEAYITDPPDLILLDVALPDRSGFDVCRTVRELPGGHSVPIVIMTGLDDPDTIKQAYTSGASDFAVKPLNWTVLSNRLSLLIEADRACRKLAASQIKLEKTERIARLGTWEYDLATEQVSASRETARILGIPETECSSRDALLSSIHPLDRDRAIESLREMVDDLAEAELEHRVLWSDGSVRSVKHRSQVRRDSAGHAVSVHGVLRDVTDIRRAEEKIRHLANYDRLTGLPNRHMFLELLQGTMARCERSEAIVAIAYVDLDRFKKINDTLGPEIGDELLTAVADRLRISLRRGDYLVRERGPQVARWGGDKFLVLLSDLDEVGGAAKAVRRLLRQLEIPFAVADREFFLTASAGISVYPTDGATAYELLQHAESAMYHAKDLGRNRFQFYSEWMNAASAREMDVENELHKAIEQNELYLTYQPVLDSHSQNVIGGEALVRWVHPELGTVSPDEFVPIAEAAGLIVRIGEWVLRTACRQFQIWFEAGLPRIRLAVNLSSLQLHEEDFVGSVARILAETGFDPSLLDVELTERGVALDDRRAVRSLEGLRELGIRIAVDDFGTGNSALSYLKIFPLDVLKIDRSFVQGIERESSDSAIISAVIAMAHRLGLEVVAEGVETDSQLEFLREQDCNRVQGFLFAKPLPAEDFREVFDKIGPGLGGQSRPEPS
ncbi:MAG: putative bifunctional diguanylate cyclase/phosphodiesterase [Thermoanaerobaculia bacterium]